MAEGKEDKLTVGGSNVRVVGVGLVVFYVALLLLNGKGIYEGLSKQEFGRKRDVLLKIAEPARAASEGTRLCALRDGVRNTVGIWLNGAEE